MIMYDWLHAKSRCMMMLQVSSRTWLDVIIIRVTFFPICTNRPVISLFKLSGAKSVRKVTSFLSSWDCWVFNSMIIDRMRVVSARAYNFWGGIFYEVLLSFRFVNTPVSDFFRRWHSFIKSIFYIVSSRPDLASVVCQPSNFGDKNFFC
jgi:hypothetical protein